MLDDRSLETLPPLDLLDVADQAVELQLRAEMVLARAVEPGQDGCDLAREGGRVASGFFRLRTYLADMPAVAEREELDQLLNHHHQTVEQSLMLAFRTTPCRPETRARFADLGGAGRRLRDLRDRLALEASWV